ncbi:unnamed protein product, partial [marine sediment metagenome]
RPEFALCTISGNLASESGGGIYCEDSLETTITNTIIWDSYPEQIKKDDDSTVLVTYSDVQGGWLGDDNIDEDPCFAALGYWADVNDTNIIVEPSDPNAVWMDGNYRLLPFSLCIDAGDPDYIAGPNETDLDGNPRMVDGNDDGNSVVDMGAYESNPVDASLQILPRVINRRAGRQYIIAIVHLPEGIRRSDIDANEPLILYPSLIEAERQYILGGRGRAGNTRVLAFFDKAELMVTVGGNDPTLLQAVG